MGVAGPARLDFFPSPISGHEILTTGEGLAKLEDLRRGTEADAVRSPVSSRVPAPPHPKQSAFLSPCLSRPRRRPEVSSYNIFFNNVDIISYKLLISTHS
jgi:hypothetical protein